MSNTNLLGSEEWAVLGTVDPVSQTAATVYTDDVDMSLFEQVMFIVQTGALGTGGTIDASIVSGTAASPTTLVTGKAGTQLDDSPATDDDNVQIIINCRGDELTEGHRYLRGKVVVATATSLISAIMVGKAKSLPSSDNDLASVQEIVA